MVYLFLCAIRNSDDLLVRAVFSNLYSQAAMYCILTFYFLSFNCILLSLTVYSIWSKIQRWHM